MKRHLLALINTSLVDNFLNVMERIDGGSSTLLRVLTYHRVDNASANLNLSPALLSATPEQFEMQMRFIRKTYVPVSAVQVLNAIKGKHPLPERAVLVTFDDAYRDFQQHAWSILKTYEIPVVLFVPTAYPDHSERQLWWDKLYHAVQQSTIKMIEFNSVKLELNNSQQRTQAYKQLRDYVKSQPHEDAMQFVDTVCQQLQVPPHPHNNIMSWDEIRNLAQEGVTIGAHTQTHPLLNRILLDDATKEARTSYDDLTAQLGEVLPIFAYPSGGANTTIAQRLAGADFEIAFTTERGINQLGKDNPLLLKRINIGRNTSLNIMRIQLLRSFGYIQQLRS